ENTVKDFYIVPICQATITGTVIFGDTRQPAAGVQVFQAVTDAAGHYSLQVKLGYNNSSQDLSVNAILNQPEPRQYRNTFRPATLSRCGEIVTVDLELPKILRNFGDLQGHVYDAETG